MPPQQRLYNGLARTDSVLAYGHVTGVAASAAKIPSVLWAKRVNKIRK